MGWLFRHGVLSILVLAATAAGAGELEREVGDRLAGAWAVAGIELVSGCGGFYTDNRLHDHGVSASAEHRLPVGEVVHIDKVKVKRSRVDLLLSVDEPILVSLRDGPFELFNEARALAERDGERLISESESMCDPACTKLRPRLSELCG